MRGDCREVVFVEFFHSAIDSCHKDVMPWPEEWKDHAHPDLGIIQEDEACLVSLASTPSTGRNTVLVFDVRHGLGIGKQTAICLRLWK